MSDNRKAPPKMPPKMPPRMGPNRHGGVPMKIEGMMCMHCSGRVQKVLAALDGVESAVASHENGTAVVTLSTPVDDDVLKITVENEGYKVLSVE